MMSLAATVFAALLVIGALCLLMARQYLKLAALNQLVADMLNHPEQATTTSRPQGPVASWTSGGATGFILAA